MVVIFAVALLLLGSSVALAVRSAAVGQAGGGGTGGEFGEPGGIRLTELGRGWPSEAAGGTAVASKLRREQGWHVSRLALCAEPPATVHLAGAGSGRR